ncbi:hypothetical protein [Phreatobacter oligotrophus]|nr:hypothetical protein [Phreatobacter oligotrophus]
MDILRWRATSRTVERLMVAYPTILTDVERASRFLCLQRTAWSG